MRKKEITTKEEFQGDVLDLTRKILETVQLKDISWANKLTGQERINFLRFCATTAADPFFDQVIAGLYSPLLEAAALRSENYDIVSFHRATCNGVSLVGEFIKRYAMIYRDEFEKDPEPFDAQKSFEPLPDQ